MPGDRQLGPSRLVDCTKASLPKVTNAQVTRKHNHKIVQRLCKQTQAMLVPIVLVMFVLLSKVLMILVLQGGLGGARRCAQRGWDVHAR